MCAVWIEWRNMSSMLSRALSAQAKTVEGIALNNCPRVLVGVAAMVDSKLERFGC